MWKSRKEKSDETQLDTHRYVSDKNGTEYDFAE